MAEVHGVTSRPFPYAPAEGSREASAAAPAPPLSRPAEPPPPEEDRDIVEDQGVGAQLDVIA